MTRPELPDRPVLLEGWVAEDLRKMLGKTVAE
jgi:hypothetical protein